MADFSHLNLKGEAAMVDVSTKSATSRVALVTGKVRVSEDCARHLGKEQLREIFSMARVAAVQAAKKTADLIPMCHQVPLAKVDVELSFTERDFLVAVTTKTTAPTGVEMEGFVGASTACLTIYDMIKAVDPGAIVGPIQLKEKTGGKNGPWKNQ